MRVLIVHNTYRQSGGEDAVVTAEAEMLTRRGHAVETWIARNDDLDDDAPLRNAVHAVWSQESREEAARRCARFRPDVVHVHNTFAILSPSVYWGFASQGPVVVQTLHNFRLACPQAMLLREGRVCEKCVGRLPLPALRHGCYHGSRGRSGVVAAMVTVHRGLGTWRRKVDRYIALNRFARQKFIAAGLDGERISVKPNFVDAPHRPVPTARDGLLFVGRLSEEKGVEPLARVMRTLPGIALTVIGDGPCAGVFDGLPNVRRLGRLPASDVAREMQAAAALVLPSICYENFPRTLVEAYAAGLPVIGNRIGALAELVEDGVTGRLCDVHDTTGFAAALQSALAQPQALAAMGERARACYEAHYTPERNYRELMNVYRAAGAMVAA